MIEKVPIVAMLAETFSSQLNLEAMWKHVPRMVYTISLLGAWSFDHDREAIAEAVKRSLVRGLFSRCEVGHGAMRLGEGEGLVGLKSIRFLLHLLRKSNCEIAAFGNVDVDEAGDAAAGPHSSIDNPQQLDATTTTADDVSGKAVDKEMEKTSGDVLAREIIDWYSKLMLDLIHLIFLSYRTEPGVNRFRLQKEFINIASYYDDLDVNVWLALANWCKCANFEECGTSGDLYKEKIRYAVFSQIFGSVRLTPKDFRLGAKVINLYRLHDDNQISMEKFVDTMIRTPNMSVEERVSIIRSVLKSNAERESISSNDSKKERCSWNAWNFIRVMDEALEVYQTQAFLHAYTQLRTIIKQFLIDHCIDVVFCPVMHAEWRHDTIMRFAIRHPSSISPELLRDFAPPYESMDGASQESLDTHTNRLRVAFAQKIGKHGGLARVAHAVNTLGIKLHQIKNLTGADFQNANNATNDGNDNENAGRVMDQKSLLSDLKYLKTVMQISKVCDAGGRFNDLDVFAPVNRAAAHFPGDPTESVFYCSRNDAHFEEFKSSVCEIASIVTVDFLCRWQDPRIHRPAPFAICIGADDKVYIFEPTLNPDCIPGKVDETTGEFIADKNVDIRKLCREHKPMPDAHATAIVKLLANEEVVKIVDHSLKRLWLEQLHRGLFGFNMDGEPAQTEEEVLRRLVIAPVLDVGVMFQTAVNTELVSIPPHFGSHLGHYWPVPEEGTNTATKLLTYFHKNRGGTIGSCFYRHDRTSLKNICRTVLKIPLDSEGELCNYEPIDPDCRLTARLTHHLAVRSVVMSRIVTHFNILYQDKENSSKCDRNVSLCDEMSTAFLSAHLLRLETIGYFPDASKSKINTYSDRVNMFLQQLQFLIELRHDPEKKTCCNVLSKCLNAMPGCDWFSPIITQDLANSSSSSSPGDASRVDVISTNDTSPDPITHRAMTVDVRLWEHDADNNPAQLALLEICEEELVDLNEFRHSSLVSARGIPVYLVDSDDDDNNNSQAGGDEQDSEGGDAVTGNLFEAAT